MSESPEQLFERLLQQKEEKRLPPVDQWHPEREAEIDIRIAADGTWYHEGGAIRRQSLVELFASILRREGDQYFLVTPGEKLAIEVEDVPFQVVQLECSGSGDSQRLLFKTATGDTVLADQAHPLEVEQPDSEPAPYVLVRDGMWGRLSRNAYYQLAELAEPMPEKSGRVGVRSCGCWFELGPAE